VVKTWKPILAALVIFAAGVVTGALTLDLRQPPWNPAIGPRSESNRKPYASARWDVQLRDISKRMEEQFDLTRDQRDRITAIVRETQSRMKALWEDVAPGTREEMRQMREKIRAELTPEQRKKFEAIFKQRAERSHPRSAAPGEKSSKPPPNP
jgi:Spy/CpxP family protein refolding chaperone